MNGINFNTSLTNTAPTGPRQDNSVGDTASQASIFSANSSDNASSVSISSKAHELAKAEEKATNQTSATGYQIMLDRLFGGKEPPVAHATGTIDSFMQLGQVFLTREDRALVADMYEYAQSQGADLKYVDEIAYTLGRYRQRDDGKMMFSFNSGDMYDSQGRQLTVSFDGEMAAVADSILSGAAINSTRFDRGFLRYQLDPGFGALTSGYAPAFLEHMVNHFSSESGSQEPLNGRFAIHAPPKIESHYVMSASEEIRLPPWEPDVMNINGKWIITEKGRANGITMEEVLGFGSPRNRTAEIRDENIRYLLDATFGKNEANRPAWVNTLREMMEKYDDSGIRLFTPKVIDGKSFLFEAQI